MEEDPSTDDEQWERVHLQLVLGVLLIGGDQEGVHNASYPATEWSGREKEQDNGRSTKAMLFYQGLPLFLWVEAYRTAVYIQNKCPHSFGEENT